MSGKLYVVATPLGNLDDLSPRALDVLRSADVIACEDTRRTAGLLARHGIDRPTVSCHRFNEGRRLEPILERLRSGATVAMVSDGGTPAIADPGRLLVRAALEDGLGVCPVPGPSAVTTLLSASGLPADRYVFDGFLPHRAGERRRRLRQLRDEERTIVVFETPHRILEALHDFEEILGERTVVLGRELTKIHESILYGRPREIADRLGEEVRGEITLVIAGRDPAAPDRPEERSAKTLAVWAEALERAGGDRRAALRDAARRLGVKKDELNRYLMELGEQPDAP